MNAVEEQVTIREALLSGVGENATSIQPIVEALFGLGFNEHEQAGTAFSLLEADQAAGLTFRQRLILKAAIKAVAAGLGAGSATRAGRVESAAADAGAPSAPNRLVDSAAKLVPRLSDDNGSLWELAYSNLVFTYLDAGGVVDQIRFWAEAASRQAALRSTLHQGNAPAPLLVSGLVKTGKSYTLEHVVPAVVAEVLCKQQQQQRHQEEDGGSEAPLPLVDMVVLRLRGDQLERSRGATYMLKSLLAVLLQWVREEHVCMGPGALAAAEAALAQPDLGLSSLPGNAIHAFLKAVKVPVLVLCDEVQSLFLPTIGGKLDEAGAEYIRDTFMKQLLVYGPHTMLWCMTGSSMAYTWISLADMPPNGYAVVASSSAVHLPATYSAAHIQWAWQQLQQASGVPLDPRLLELCPRSIALLVVLVRAWVFGGHPSDVAAFVRGFMQSKLIDESRREWKLGLEAMPVSQRLTILDLTVPALGASIKTELHPGLLRYLLPHLDETEDGERYYFRDSHQRQIVRLLINNDGTLRDSWSELEFSATLTQLDGAWNLFYLGECADYLLGPNANRRWQREQPPAGMGAFEAKLQAIANDIADKLLAALVMDQQQPDSGVARGPPELWERQPWFQAVLNSKWNDRDLEAYMRNRRARRTHLAMLVFYLRLSRNVLGHTKQWDRENGATVDVGLIEVLPGVLGQSLFAFNEAMVEALRLLSRRTVEAAAADFAAELLGGVGGSWEDSVEDDSSSGGDLSSGTGGSSAGGLSSGKGGGSGGDLSSGTGGSSAGGLGSGSGGRGRGPMAMPDQRAHLRPRPAAAQCGHSGVQRAPTLAPRLLRLRLPLLAPAAAAAAAAIGPRLPCR
ncbi:hypothetical protein HXX76_010739 [Chlamydomonas incerta]|uniref:Uncharacterized protein n=1 Tax=Chlamydomonas incerta TaxID=51695 RepID=A0A835SLY5_CHLIN|nr:hypothetical protein HXX76_010739 [Chlamydomonas incerta]|eukprot:KAG2429503.1 hypothetical protein HXX76_010739 [Chlamydomonas incerta]